jgi:hypothetical protein
MDWPHDNEAEPAEPRLGWPRTFEPAPEVLVLYAILEMILVAITLLALWEPDSRIDDGALAIFVALLPIAALWTWLVGYVVTVDEEGLTVSTNLWRIRGRQPVHFRRSDGVSAVAHDSYDHRTVTINGLHIENPAVTIFSPNSLAAGLRLASIPVEERSATIANLAHFPLFFAMMFVMIWGLDTPGLGFPIISVGAVLIVGLYTLHAVRVDRQWRRIAARVSAGSAAQTGAEPRPARPN